MSEHWTRFVLVEWLLSLILLFLLVCCCCCCCFCLFVFVLFCFWFDNLCSALIFPSWLIGCTGTNLLNTRFTKQVQENKGAWTACWLERQTRARLRVRVPAGAAGEYSSPELTFSAESHSVSLPHLCYRSGTEKDPGHSVKSAGDRLHLSTHTPLTHRSWNGLTMLSKQNELTRKSSANTRP